ncbi:DUF4148 domain-containing protein [Paraburkholderia silviterrae]|uniref:DUF4148 domain-containing protein n=1 Tax=Paraburkholderia silviterrae TaxID=2528715 RepID=A0A4R5LZJ2_9BURK|nr:DUF4148 domain-containing protein [Paraburkholderia silviterrae]TDG17743.1 DUF4148 domain-containing protein [Paraburkholderia silviterrae]
MKSLVQVVIVAATLAAPLVAFAQSNQPVTRAQVHEELLQVEKAGYNPDSHAHRNDYPDNLQAAEARVAEQNSAMGGVAGGSSQQGQPAR